jgi:hypothetical protein
MSKSDHIKKELTEVPRSNFSLLMQIAIRLNEVIKGSWVALSINIIILSINVYLVFVVPNQRDRESAILENQHSQMVHISAKMDSVSNHLQCISESLSRLDTMNIKVKNKTLSKKLKQETAAHLVNVGGAETLLSIH